jgi:hypothetical protein
MSAKMNFPDLVHKVMHEPGFLSKLKSDPEAALKGAGVQPTPSMLAALKTVDYNSIRSVAQAFDNPGQPFN